MFYGMVMAYNVIHGLDGASFDEFFKYHDVSTSYVCLMVSSYINNLVDLMLV